jgi:hypothetical protein
VTTSASLMVRCARASERGAGPRITLGLGLGV